MKVIAHKLTDEKLMQAACSATMRGRESKMTLDRIYSCMHSPIRCVLFWVEMFEIKTFVSVHLVRHSQGISHFVGSNREDRRGVKADRDTLINHSFLANAEALINMSRKRLCGQASKETQETMQAIKDAVALVDPYLPKYMIRECEFRNGKCPELKCCGNLYVPM